MGRKKDSSSAVMPPQPLSRVDSIWADYERANGFFLQGKYFEALKLIIESISRHGNISSFVILYRLQCVIALELVSKRGRNYMKLIYLNMSKESSGHATALCPNSLDLAHLRANSLFNLAELNKDPKGYEKAVEECERGLSLENPEEPFENGLRNEGLRKELERLSKRCSVFINLHKAGVDLGTLNRTVDETSMASERETVEQKQEESDQSNARLTRECRRRAEVKKKESMKNIIERLRAFWASMSVQSKHKFMKVSVEKLKGYFERLYGSEGREFLEVVLDFVEKNRKWKIWKCSACVKEFHLLAIYKEHFKSKHVMHLDPALKNVIPPKVEEEWVQMLKSGDWEPVDTVSALEMIKNRLGDEKESFVYENGWSKDWPLAKDENRENALKEIHAILMLLLERNSLPYYLRNFMMNYTLGHLIIRVPKPQFFVDCGLAITPQCICFLELAQLAELLRYFRHIIVNSCADEVSVVDSSWDHSQVKERIDLNTDFSSLLLDSRLLNGKIDALDDEGDVLALSGNDHCAGMLPEGDEIILWLFEGPTTKEEFEFHKPTRKDNSDFSLELLQKHDCQCKHYETICRNKFELQTYDKALMKANWLCGEEDERRRRILDYDSRTYAYVLGRNCQALIRTEGENINDATMDLLKVVRDVLEGALYPSYGELKSEDYSTCLSVISSKIESTGDEFVKESIGRLKAVISFKTPVMDVILLLAEDARNRLEMNLTKLSACDHRSIILPLLKSFLRKELEEMEVSDAKARSDAAEAALLADIALEEEKNKSKLQKEKKKDHRKIKDNKATSSTGKSIHLYQGKAEPEPSATYERDLSVNDTQLTQEEEEREIKMEEQLGRYPRMIVPPNTPVGEWHTVKKKSRMPKEKKKDHRKNKHTKETSTSRSIPLYQEAAEQKPENASELRQREQYHRLKVEHEEKEITMKEQIDCPRETENIFTGTDVTKKDKVYRHVAEEACLDNEASNSSEIDSLQKGLKPEDSRLATDFHPNKIDKSANAAELKQEEVDCRLKVEHEEIKKYNPESDCRAGSDPACGVLLAENALKEMDISEKDIVDGYTAGDSCHGIEASTSSDIDALRKGINTEDSALASNKIDISSLLGASPRGAGEDNCTLDMFVKSLWHVGYFLEELMSKPVSAHVHVGDPCVVCALQELLSDISVAKEDPKEIYNLLLNTLRYCLNNMHAQANDAVELLVAIFGFVDESRECRLTGSLVNKIFGLEETERMTCYKCGREPRFLERNSYSLFISTKLLREMKSVIGDIPFDKLLKLILMSDQRDCDPETGGCGKRNFVHYILSRAPLVFTLVLEWGINETPEDLSATVMALGNKIDIGVLYEVIPNVKYNLVSMVGCAEKEYTCMAYENHRWIRHYESNTVIGGWEDCLVFCRESRVKPEILFYEASRA